MAGKGGGAWKVAYADFVTAMMAFFLVMWITAQNKSVKQAVAQYFNDPYSKAKSESGAGSSSGGYTAKSNYVPAAPKYSIIAPKAGGAPDRGQATTKPKRQKDRPKAFREQSPPESKLLGPEGDDYLVPGGRVHFALEQAALDESQDKHLAQLAASLAGKNQKLEVRGHSSRQPLSAASGFRDHWDLAYARCCAVRDALVNHGLDARRIRLAVSADNEPVEAPDDPPLELRRSSRVELRLLPEFLDTATGFKEKPLAGQAAAGPDRAAPVAPDRAVPKPDP